MKRVFGILLLAVALTGCSPEDRGMDRAMKLRERVLEAEECRFRAEITADYGDLLHSFTLDCLGDREGNLSFTVAEPESIAGITGTVSDDGGRLIFDEVALQFGLLTDRQLSPVSGPWLFLRTLRGGRLTAVSPEGEGLLLSADDSYEEDALHVDIRLDGEDIPRTAEMVYRGRRILALRILDFG